MASTYSTNLAIELIGTGDQAGTWGNTTNTNLGTLIEQAISGYVTQAVSTGTDTTITIPNGATGVARNMYIELTGTGGTNTNLIVPSNKKLYFIFNNASGAVTVKVSGQTGVSVPAGKKVVLASNGTDTVNALNYIADFGSNSATITQLTATSATITNLTLTSLVISNLSIASANVTVLTSASATITNLLATSLTVSSGSTLNGGVVINEPGADVDFRVEGDTDANLFFADASTDRIGIGTSSPGEKLNVIGGNNTTSTVNFTGGSNNDNATIASDYSLVFQVDANNTVGGRVFNWRYGGNGYEGGTSLMTLNASGNLGIGTSSPTSKLDVRGANSNNLSDLGAQNVGAIDTTAYAQNNGGGISFGYVFNSGGSVIGRAAVIKAVKENATDGNYATSLVFATAANSANTIEKMRLDSSGNLGLGVTPSAWGSGRPAIQFGSSAANYIVQGGAGSLNVGWNFYYDGSVNKYIRSDYASQYYQYQGQHVWMNAASGTAGNTISFTQAMTLDASGNLGIGTTTPSRKLHVYYNNNADSVISVENISTGSSATANIQAQSDSAGGGLAAFSSTYTTSGMLASDSIYVYASSTASNGLRINAEASAPILFGTNNTERARITSGGDLLVGSTSTSGSVSNSALVLGGKHVTASGAVSTTSGVATTLFTAPTATAAYLVSISVNADRADLYSATYLISTQGNSSTVATQLYKGTNVSVSVSGYAVQATQTSGATQTIDYSMTRIY